MNTLQIQPLEATLFVEIMLGILALGLYQVFSVFTNKTLNEEKAGKLFKGFFLLASFVNLLFCYNAVY